MMFDWGGQVQADEIVQVMYRGEIEPLPAGNVLH
jgi:hypothetical protein